MAGSGVTPVRVSFSASGCVCGVHPKCHCGQATTAARLEHAERLLGADGTGFGGLLHLEDVEPHGLGQRPALAHSHDVTLLDAERRGAVHGHVGVALLETAVLLDEAQVVTADDDGAVHLGGHDDALQDAATDGHVAGERALLVDVRALERKSIVVGESGK